MARMTAQGPPAPGKSSPAKRTASAVPLDAMSAKETPPSDPTCRVSHPP